MKWLKTWLRKWLGIEAAIKSVSDLDADYTRVVNGHAKNLSEAHSQIEILKSECVKIGVRIENDRAGIRELFDRARVDQIDIVKAMERDEKRISELELLVKDATIDTALAALEDRVAKLEATPIPSGPQGRRGGFAWGPHQVAAAAGAALANGSPVPIPTPGVS